MTVPRKNQIDEHTQKWWKKSAAQFLIRHFFKEEKGGIIM